MDHGADAAYPLRKEPRVSGVPALKDYLYAAEHSGTREGVCDKVFLRVYLHLYPQMAFNPGYRVYDYSCDFSSSSGLTSFIKTPCHDVLRYSGFPAMNVAPTV